MSGEEVSLSSPDALKLHYNKEKKELQAKIMALKNSINKNDKKRKREVNETIDLWEKELKTRYDEQFKLLELEQKMTNSTLVTTETTAMMPDNSVNETAERKKPSRAQQRRDKKADEIQRKLAAEMVDELNAEFSQASIENAHIRKVLEARNLRVHEIVPDGDCLFNAISHQLARCADVKYSGAQLRRLAVQFIRDNRNDFLPFLIDRNGVPISIFHFDEYCGKVEKTSENGGEWGGETELRAISAVLRRPIEVVQPDGRVIHFGEEFASPSMVPLVIAYHRFTYTLGEHYNSTVPLSDDDESMFQ